MRHAISREGLHQVFERFPFDQIGTEPASDCVLIFKNDGHPFLRMIDLHQTVCIGCHNRAGLDCLVAIGRLPMLP